MSTAWARKLLVPSELLVVAALMHSGTAAAQAPVTRVHATDSGFEATIGTETLRVIACSDSVIHVLAYPGSAPVQASSPEQPWMLPRSESCPGLKSAFTESNEDASITAGKLTVKILKDSGGLVYSTVDGVELLREWPAIPRTYEPVVVNGVHALHTEDRFSPAMTEGLYGLGQHQNGMFNYRGATIELGQDNTDIAIPLLLSTRGYGLLWNTASLTYFDNRYPQVYSFASAAENAIDYYFIYGPEFDAILHHYRQMTGKSPLLPEWAYGFFQSKDSYESQDEILSVARQYRSSHLPLDCIVQDGGWWKAMGDLPFRSDYPDVAAELKELHGENVHAMLSVWGDYKPDSLNYKRLQAHGWLVPGTMAYDATNPAARDFFWKSLPGPLLAQGWDAFWLDASEPDSGAHQGDALLLGKQLAIGSGTMYTNIFPLLHTAGIAEHWMQANQQKRVVLLTRSAFLGEQRNGVIVWSGDTYPTNWSFRHQIAAGLNYAVSGMPYWTTDVAGYFPSSPGATMTSPEYQDLYLRWFEFGAFSPVFRTHGHRPHNEIWTYDRVAPALEMYDRLRSRMMPYLYSLAWKVTNDDYTILRPLVMDWRTDPMVEDIADEYMFGPAFLVSPVWQQGATTRDVYLPDAPAWYNFWTGENVAGRQHREIDAPLDTMPLFVRAGSILPLGPEIEYAGQKPGDPIELRIYPGADGAFDLYQDEGDGDGYKSGAHSVIPIRWSDSDGKLTIGERIGSFPGMPQQLVFHIVLVRGGHGTGEAVSGAADQHANYEGKEIEVTVAPR
jgi:alpha-D-xyloside xylohydrolase